MNNHEGDTAGVMAARAVKVARGIQEIEASPNAEPAETLRKVTELEAICRQGLAPRDTERFQRSLSELRQRFRVQRQGRFRLGACAVGRDTETSRGLPTSLASLGSPESDGDRNAPEARVSPQLPVNSTLNRTSGPASGQGPEGSSPPLSVLKKSTMAENPPQELSLPDPQKFVSTGTDHSGASDTFFHLFSSSSVHIRDSQRCTIVADCHQLRLSNCVDCKVFASCPRVAIETCSNLEIGYIAGQPRWDGVDDFGWLKGGKNPHWTQGGEISADQVVELRHAATNL